jgi:hypothetical protein
LGARPAVGGYSSRSHFWGRVVAWSLEGVGQRGPAWRSGRLTPSDLIRRFSRTSRRKLTSSSLFAKRDRWILVRVGIALCSSLLRSSAARLRRSKREKARFLRRSQSDGHAYTRLRWTSGGAGRTRSPSPPCSWWSCSEPAEPTRLGGRLEKAYAGADSLVSCPSRGLLGCSRWSRVGERRL